MQDADISDLELIFQGALVVELGAQQYPGLTATVAELISNAWDADARRVWVSIPFGDAWTSDAEVLVLDDGIGMSHDEAQRRYLNVGTKRRQTHGRTSAGGRRVHGRKGIGKLAAFGTATELECVTLQGGVRTAFRLDYDAIRKLPPGKNFSVLSPTGDLELTDPDTGEPLEHGTRIRLTGLRPKRLLTEAQFLKSMSRRFALSATDMRVLINERPLGRFEMDLEFRLPKDGSPKDVEADGDGWGVEDISGKPVRWWFGFTELPIEEERLQGVSIIANGKMLHRPFFFERGEGTTGQLGRVYMVGEVVADWLDDGVDVEDDLTQTNRDQLQLEDPRLEDFLKWGQSRLAWALRTRNDLRRTKRDTETQQNEQLLALIESHTETEQRMFMNIARTLSTADLTKARVLEFMEGTVDAYDDAAVRELIQRIDQEEDATRERFWELVAEFGLIDARRRLSMITARLETIEGIQRAVREGATEVPILHNMIRNDPWLIDPRWEFLDDEVTPEKVKEEFDVDVERDDDQGPLDFLFALGRSDGAGDVIVVEIKRGSYPDGRVRHANELEVNRFVHYVTMVKEILEHSTEHPTVSGKMIAQGYTRDATRIRRVFEQARDPVVTFETWDSAIKQTKALHVAWLDYSKRRAAR